MKRGSRVPNKTGGKAPRKRKVAEPSLLDITAPAELFQRCFTTDIVLGCLAPFLSLPNLIRFLRCDKRLYTIYPSWWIVLRECCRLHGATLDVTNKWIKHCLQSRNLEALRWLFNDRLGRYAARLSYDTRHTPEGAALVCCLPVGLRTAFKMGYRQGIDCILDWRAKELALAMQKWPPIYHLYNYTGNTEAIHNALPDAMVAGCAHGHTALVREFFETHCQDFVFPRDTFNGSWSPGPHHTMEGKKQEQFAFRLLCECVSNGDVTNYPFYVELYEKVPELEDGWKERLFLSLLRDGKNPVFLPLLVCEVPYPEEWAGTYHEWLRVAFQNRDPCMLRYVLSIIPARQLHGYHRTFRQEFFNIKTLFAKACGQLTWNMENRKLLKLIHSLQARYLFLMDMLTKPPFKMELDDLRQSGNAWFRDEWKWGE